MARDVSKADVASDVNTKQQLLKRGADAFSASVIGNLSSSEIRLIDASSFNDLSTEQVGALTAGQISSLSVAQFSALPASSIGELGKFYDVLNAITADQWSALTPTQYANIGLEAQKNSATDQLYSAKGVPAFDKNFDLSGLTPAQLPSISVEARHGLGQIKRIDADTDAVLLLMPKMQDADFNATVTGTGSSATVDGDVTALGQISIEVHGIRPESIQSLDADTAAALLLMFKIQGADFIATDTGTGSSATVDGDLGLDTKGGGAEVILSKADQVVRWEEDDDLNVLKTVKLL